MRLRRHKLALAPALALAVLILTGCAAGTGGVVEAGDQTRGKDLFKEKCAPCHVLGDAQAAGRVGPDLDAVFGADYQQGFAESTVRQVVADQIRYAGDYGTEGPTMPRNLVKGDDVDAVAAYVAARAAGGPEAAMAAGPGGASTGTTTGPGTTPPPSGGGGGGGATAAAGKQAFDSNGCSSCHTFKPAGATGTVGPDLDKLPSYAQKAGKPLEDFIRESITDPNAYVEKGFPQGVMPPFNSLPPTTIDSLVKFLTSTQ